MKKFSPNLIILAILSFLFFAYLIENVSKNKSHQTVVQQPVEKIPVDLGAEEKMNIEIFRRMSASTVFIKNAALIGLDFFSLNLFEIPQGAGSGIIWDREGHIVTNYHVIHNSSSIEVVLSDKMSYEASVIGIAPDYDIAVLKIKAQSKNLTSIPIGDSQNLMVGQKVLAIGNPFGLDHSLSTGVISALGRSITSLTGRKIHNVIQTDAAINPGNSGGPLLDSQGRIIGINTLIYSPSGGSSGVGFAVPIETVQRIVPQLINNGKISKAGLGVVLVPDNIRFTLGREGAMILEVARGSAAHKAGLKGTFQDLFGSLVIGDIIVQIDDTTIRNNDDLIEYFESGPGIGSRVKIVYLRDGRKNTTEAYLQEISITPK